MQLSEKDIEALLKTKMFIELNVFSRIILEELCKVSGMGKSKLIRTFQFTFQISTISYHLIISMEYAKCLLEEGRQVKEIAILFGYGNPDHFSRAFRKVFFHPPSHFKLQK